MDIATSRETFIFTSTDTPLYPADDLFPDNGLFPNTTQRRIANIVSGSLLLEERIVEDFPIFGKIFSTRFEVQVYDEQDLSGSYIHVYQVDDGVYHSIFTGIVDSCKLDKTGKDRTIVAYDMAYSLGNVNVASWWTEFWQNRDTATLRQVRNSLMEHMSGIPYEDVALTNDSIIVQKNVEFTSLPFFTILQMICEISACFPHIDRDGVMRFLQLDTRQSATSLVTEYEWNTTEFEGYETAPITGVQFYDSDGELEYTVGSHENPISIVSNVFLYTMNFDQLYSIGAAIMSIISGYVFKPTDLHMIISNLNLKLAQRVFTEQGVFYILEQIFSGPQFIEQEIKATGSSTMNQGTQPVDLRSKILNQKIARVVQTVDEFEIEYQDFAQQTSASLRLNAQAIETEVTRAQTKEQQIDGTIATVNETLSSRITQTAEQLTTEVTRAQSAESTIDGRITTVNTNLSSRITQNANSISSEVTRAQSAESDLAEDIGDVDDKVDTVNETLSSRITQTAEQLTTEVTRAQSAESTIDGRITTVNTNLSSRITQNATSITSEVTRAQRAENGLSDDIEEVDDKIDTVNSTLSSRITQTANSITTEVTRAQGVESSLSSRITQNANSITTKVTQGTVSSEISQEAGQITITSNRLEIQATNFSLNSNGTITCNNAKLSGEFRNIDSSTGHNITISNCEILFDPTKSGQSYINSQASIVYDSSNGLELETVFARIMLNQGRNSDMYIHLDPDVNNGYIELGNLNGPYPSTEVRIPMRGGGTAVLEFNNGLLINTWTET